MKTEQRQSETINFIAPLVFSPLLSVRLDSLAGLYFLIPLTQGKFAIVDAKNYKWLNQHKWYAVKCKNTFYAVRNVGESSNQHRIYMHRQIMNVPKDKQTDHRNHTGLDNRETNLRICTRSQNQHNRKSQNSISKFKGVTWCKRDRKWKAQIKYNGKTIHLGNFINEIEAAKRYDEAAKKLFGEFANCNFISSIGNQLGSRPGKSSQANKISGDKKLRPVSAMLLRRCFWKLSEQSARLTGIEKLKSVKRSPLSKGL